MKVSVLCFGPLRELMGADSLCITLKSGGTVADLRLDLRKNYPSLGRWLAGSQIAVNRTLAGEEVEVKETDEIALIPPVSGGAQDDDVWVALVGEPIPVDRVRAFVRGRTAVGAMATFEGTTRAQTDPQHGTLVRLEYEAYQDMAVAELDRLARQAKERWGLAAVAVIHRVGDVAVGEVSVMIAVASGHRAEAFDSCRWLIDSLKKDVPIWKRDRFEDGFRKWVDPNSGHEMKTPGSRDGASSSP